METMTDRRQMFGLAGAALLIIGTFLPLVTMPIVGSLNYFLNGKGDGIYVVGYGGLAILFTLIKRYKLLWIPALLAIAQLTYALINFNQKLSEAAAMLENNIFGQGLASAIRLDWAWIVLYAGAALLVVAATRKEPAKDSD
jgi:energy-converting hydrogenase Eha subunit E